ncbi:MAG: TetR/AcrR family transcriptional regulator [Burkholderiales bacterium]|nr:TetR/AcrR family transcriptional regulator [Burkholderiales bacterium]
MQATPRRTGRPDAQSIELINRKIMDTATQLFIEQGYAATSVDQIASVAGAGKQTIYRRYASKEELFGAVILELVRSVLENPLKMRANAADPLQALRDFSRSLLDLAFVKPETMSLYRILVSEALRFPDLVALVTKSVLQPIDDMLIHLLEAARKKGQVRADVPIEDQCHILGGMCTGWVFQQTLFGNRSLSNETERDAFFESIWTVFVKGAVDGVARQ